MSGKNNYNMLKQIPAVDEILQRTEVKELQQKIPKILVLEAVREIAAEIRQDILMDRIQSLPENNPRQYLLDLITTSAADRAREKNRPNLRRVINATGVVLHTNLGRAVLSERACQAIEQAASGYSNLELDLQTGKRGSRYAPVENLLTRLTGAESALVVNNNAAAVLLALSTMAKEKEVIVSRGQLVEIGGSFRIPEVMAQSGAKLVEVGATNKTHPRDYKNAVTSETALLLHVHTSNYRVVGFTRETSVAELVSIGKEFQLPVMSDLGSGSLIDLSTFGLPEEPTVQETVKAGCDIVTFSGDKLLGGPQAGIIVGKTKYLEKMKKNPLTRAIRIDKFTVAALEATLREYLEPDNAIKNIPSLKMLSAKKSEHEQRALALCRKLTEKAGLRARFEPVEIFSAVGGGALPTAELPFWAIEVVPYAISVAGLAQKLRGSDPAVIGRLQEDKLILDLRTVLNGEEEVLVDILCRVLEQGGTSE
ncbi:L-seryl-tRNA(Sec) selenium transferase [Desulfotruncus alcoholivorax]|uniref:L-seryl-tRNA(Sec) selenium transferase n=1 Tax=Desulfotruncus alcoholivorax TaxID=265477 RepID=UPI0004861766|nr:L-seryl-tRNA(Sec) selenium transferase [Desulfotruncus alcoholivorax]